MSTVTKAEESRGEVKRLGIVETKEKEMKQGIIVVFNAKKFWGFVREDSTSEEYFFHQDNCPGFKPYLAGRVEFEIAAPLRIGLKDQAVGLRSLDEAEDGGSL